MAEKSRTEVMIDGRNFTVVSGNSEEYTKEIAKYVDEKIRELSSRNIRLDGSMTAILAALNITDELYKKEKQYKELERISKDPLERYDLVCEETEKLKDLLRRKEEEKKELNQTIEEKQEENERLFNQIKYYKRTLDNRTEALTKAENKVKELQEININNQKEIIKSKENLEKTKKELKEYIELLDEKTS